MTRGELMDLMNRDYDRNDPQFLQEVQLKVYAIAKNNGRAEVVSKIKQNMVTKPETIGLSKDSKCLFGIEQKIETIDKAYEINQEEKKETTTRTR